MVALAETYFQKLPNSVNRDFIDQVRIVDFNYIFCLTHQEIKLNSGQWHQQLYNILTTSVPVVWLRFLFTYLLCQYCTMYRGVGWLINLPIIWVRLQGCYGLLG